MIFMGTRANVVLSDGDGVMSFYKRCDGYPSETMPTLEKFMDLVKSGKIKDNVLESSGWLILLGADEIKDNEGDDWKDRVPCVPYGDSQLNHEASAYQFSYGLNADIMYLYVVDLVAKTIKSYSVGDCGVEVDEILDSVDDLYRLAEEL